MNQISTSEDSCREDNSYGLQSDWKTHMFLVLSHIAFKHLFLNRNKSEKNLTFQSGQVFCKENFSVRSITLLFVFYSLILKYCEVFKVLLWFSVLTSKPADIPSASLPSPSSTPSSHCLPKCSSGEVCDNDAHRKFKLEVTRLTHQMHSFPFEFSKCRK